MWVTGDKTTPQKQGSLWDLRPRRGLLNCVSEPAPLATGADRIQIQHLFKLTPAPHLRWRVKVMKSLGPQQWLVGSQGPAPKGWLGFNGETILVIFIQQRTLQPQAVQATHRALVPPPLIATFAPCRSNWPAAPTAPAGAASPGPGHVLGKMW